LRVARESKNPRADIRVASHELRENQELKSRYSSCESRVARIENPKPQTLDPHFETQIQDLTRDNHEVVRINDSHAQFTTGSIITLFNDIIFVTLTC